MFREDMALDAGMLFLFDREALRSFWMKNTLIPLDLIFIDSQGVIVSITHDAIPHDETPIPSGLPAVGALELNGGAAAALSIHPGDRVTHRAFGM